MNAAESDSNGQVNLWLRHHADAKKTNKTVNLSRQIFNKQADSKESELLAFGPWSVGHSDLMSQMSVRHQSGEGVVNKIQ